MSSSPAASNSSPSSPESRSTKVRRGSCLCRSVQYTLTGDPITFRICHCQNCRKATGSAFLSNVFFTDDKINFEQGADMLHMYSDRHTGSGNTLERSFCRNCGSNVFMRPTDTVAVSKKLRIVNLGTLDEETDWVPQKEMFPEHRREYIKGIELAVRKPRM